MSSFDEQVEFLVQEIQKAEAQAYFHKKAEKTAKQLESELRAELLKTWEGVGGLEGMECLGNSLKYKIAKPGVEIVDIAAIPQSMLKETKPKLEPDKTKIKKFLKNNKVNWANLTEPKAYVEIRKK